MINFLRGKILVKRDGFIVIDVAGVGYKVFVNSSLLSDTSIGKESEIYIYHHVREDISALYGFKNMEELELFEMLLSISGIGPKSAIGVLTIASVADIKDSIAKGDSGLLIKVSGIGKKTAERVVLELQDKVGSLAVSQKDGIEKGEKSLASSSDEIDAMVALGYSLQQARDALRKVDPEIKDSGERIKNALKNA
jgi:holliday junction DNA helicase RuvA